MGRTHEVTHIPAVQGVWSAGQHCPHTIGVFKLDKPEASRLVGGFIFHDDTIHNLAILGKVAAQSLCSEAGTKAHVSSSGIDSAHMNIKCTQV